MIQQLDTHRNLAGALNGVFDSQITGGKRYDLTVEGRRVAYATFFDSHSVDHSGRVACAVDLTPQIASDEPKDLRRFVADVVKTFHTNLATTIDLLN